jgi:hypothetical protein
MRFSIHAMFVSYQVPWSPHLYRYALLLSACHGEDFRYFDLFVYVCSGYTKVGFLLKVSWWVDLLDRG